MCTARWVGRGRVSLTTGQPSEHSGCGRGGGGKYHTWVMSTVVCIHALTRLAKYHIRVFSICVHVHVCVCVYMPSHQALEWLKLFRRKVFNITIFSRANEFTLSHQIYILGILLINHSFLATQHNQHTIHCLHIP